MHEHCLEDAVAAARCCTSFSAMASRTIIAKDDINTASREQQPPQSMLPSMSLRSVSTMCCMCMSGYDVTYYVVHATSRTMSLLGHSTQACRSPCRHMLANNSARTVDTTTVCRQVHCGVSHAIVLFKGQGLRTRGLGYTHVRTRGFVWPRTCMLPTSTGM